MNSLKHFSHAFTQTYISQGHTVKSTLNDPYLNPILTLNIEPSLNLQTDILENEDHKNALSSFSDTGTLEH